MKAFIFNKYGGPEVAELREVPKPAAAAGELLIRVEAAGLNPVDFKIREGNLKVIQSLSFPVIAGCELAGTVEALGSGVKNFTVGDRVYVRVAKEKLGAFAEYATVSEDLVAAMPRSIDFEMAAGVPLAGLTALQALRDELHVKPGSRIFIPGGAGGVGTFAIQIAKWLGAHVITTASPRGRELVQRLGADEVIDYTTQDFEKLVQNSDGAFDLVGDETLWKSFRVVKRGGTVVSVVGMPEPLTARKDLQRGFLLAALFWVASFRLRAAASKEGVTYRFLFMHPSGADLALMARLIDDKKIEPVIDRVFPFAQIADAFAYLESGRAKGKVVVRVR
jgi:NADPH:quinone reductase-like Zn-dependent oxidoreductase